MEYKNNEGNLVAKLVCVTGANNNKYYNMTQINSDQFEAVWGRVEGSESRKIYPMSKWASTYKSKTSPNKKPKPYTDVTNLHVEENTKKVKSTPTIIKSTSTVVKNVIKEIIGYSSLSVKQNYTVSSKDVSKKQIDTAQDVLNTVVSLVEKSVPKNRINDKLIELYTVIPRKMNKVQNYLIPDVKDYSNIVNKLITSEQDTLDALAGQVNMNQNDNNVTSEDILENAGLDVRECTNKEIVMIKKMMGANSSQFLNAIKITNRRTQDMFDKHVANADNKKSALLWHGSRNENWWGISQEGLKIRPTNAIITAKMFGFGSYFADKAKKSMGYTSLRGSYWARGGQDKGFIALYNIHQGNQWEILRHKNEYTKLTHDKVSAKGYDSVFAKGGWDLINNEYITYQTEQTTIEYLVQIKN